jgi:hypothetical protein
MIVVPTIEDVFCEQSMEGNYQSVENFNELKEFG